MGHRGEPSEALEFRMMARGNGVTPPLAGSKIEKACKQLRTRRVLFGITCGSDWRGVRA
jgi:hypothetical protein